MKLFLRVVLLLAALFIAFIGSSNATTITQTISATIIEYYNIDMSGFDFGVGSQIDLFTVTYDNESTSMNYFWDDGSVHTTLNVEDYPSNPAFHSDATYLFSSDLINIMSVKDDSHLTDYYRAWVFEKNGITNYFYNNDNIKLWINDPTLNPNRLSMLNSDAFYVVDFGDITIATIPEPSTIFLFSLGILFFAAHKRNLGLDHNFGHFVFIFSELEK